MKHKHGTPVGLAAPVRVVRVLCHPPFGAMRNGPRLYRLWDMMRHDMGIIGGAQHYRERITMDLTLEVISVVKVTNGETIVSLKCPSHLPNLALKGTSSNVTLAYCREGVITVHVAPGGNSSFEIDFDAMVTAPLDGIAKGFIAADLSPAMAATPEKPAAPVCTIDYLSITADVSAGSSS